MVREAHGVQEVGEGVWLLRGVGDLSRALENLLVGGRLPDTRASVPSHPAQSLEGDGRTIVGTFESPCSLILLSFQKARFGES